MCLPTPRDSFLRSAVLKRPEVSYVPRTHQMNFPGFRGAGGELPSAVSVHSIWDGIFFRTLYVSMALSLISLFSKNTLTQNKFYLYYESIDAEFLLADLNLRQQINVNRGVNLTKGTGRKESTHIVQAFCSYSRRNTRSIVNYVPGVATWKTGKRASRMRGLFSGSSLRLCLGYETGFRSIFKDWRYFGGKFRRMGMGKTVKEFIKRSSVDRRSRMDRRILDLGPRHQGRERRKGNDRRQGWEDRYGWERSSRWSSTPIYSDVP